MERNRKILISKNTVNKILSITIAITLWVIVIGGENPIKDRTIHDVPVVLNNLDVLTDNNLAIAGDTDYTVDVKIKGQRTIVDPLTVKDIKVEADLFGYGKGQNYINVTATIPDNTELVEIRSPRIQVILEDLVAVSKPVNISFRNVPEGKEVGGLVLQPTGVEVSGAQSLVDSVAWAFGTVNAADYAGSEANTVQVELQPLNDGEALVENVRMSSQYADVTYTLMDVKEVPLVVTMAGDPGLNMAVDEIIVSETVKIRGLTPDLEMVQELIVEPVDLAALELDETGHAALTLTPILPQGVELSRDNTVLKGSIRVKEVSAEIIDYGGEDIRIVNLPEGVEASIDPGRYTVTVKAGEEMIETLEKEDIVLEVDGSGLTAEDLLADHNFVAGNGRVELEIKAVCEKAFDQVDVMPKTVMVNVTVTE